MKYLGPVSNEKDIITKEYLEEKGNAATSTAFKMQDIPGGSDLNDYLTPGFYGVKSTAIGQTILNSPISNAFSLIVRYSYNSATTNQRITQIISSFSQNKAEAYIRNMYSGVFGEWDKIILESDLESELSGYLPLSGGTVDGTLITDGSFQSISGGSQRGGFFKYPGTTGGLASTIFTFHETEEDAKNLTNIRSVIGHLSDGITPSYIYFAIVDTESDKNSWDQSQGLAIGKTFLRWKGTDIITKKNVVSQTSAGLMSASDKTKLDGIAIMTGATTSVAGKSGLVPAPAAGSETRYLRSDGTWQVPPNTTYKLSSFGITATAAELNHLDGITATVTELNYTDGVTSNIQTQLNAKAALASPTFTGTPKAPTADAGTNTTQIATTAYVKTEINNVLAAAGALIYKGTIGTDGTITALPASHKVGDTYVVATAGSYAGETCEIGDMIICVATRTTANNADWNIVQTNVNGAVTGPASAVTNRVATFNGATGKVIKDSGFTIASSVPANAKFTDTTYTLSSFGITATATELNRLDGITATTAELNYTDGVTSNIQTQLNSKAANTAMKGATSSAAGATGLVPVPAAGKQTSFLRGDGTWVIPTNTTYSNMKGATSSAAGKAGLAPAPSAGAANRYLRSDGTWAVPPDTNTTYTLSSFGITATAAELNKLDGVTATKTEINYLDGVTSAIQTQLNAKQATITGGASTITSSNLTANRALVSNASGKVAVSTVTSTELGYLDGVTSAIQTQLNSKFNTSGGTISGLVTPNGGFAHVGTANYIVFPDGGQSVGTSSSMTGFLQIILPVEYTSTMLKFKVSIYNYDTGTSVDYIIGGYTYSGSNTWTNCTAICIGKPGTSLSNLPVTFGNNGTKCVVAIGAANTSWDYPQVTISDVTLGYSGTTYSTWTTGWGIAWSTSALAEVDTTISNTNVSYGATPGSHTHSAANITSGTLAVARGGTGLTAAPSLLVNLGSTTAASVFAASPRPGITGTLTISHGGTGATTAAGVLTNLGITATAAELNKLDGVTATATELNYVDGVTSNIQTQINNVKPKLVTVTLSSSQWTESSSGYTQKETVSGVSATETAQMINIIPKVSNQAAYIQAGVYASAQAANSITFTALKKPTVNLTVYVVIETI